MSRLTSSTLCLILSLINHNQEQEPLRSYENVDLRFSEIVSDTFLLKSFSPNQVFHELTLLIGDLKKEGSGVENVEKRLTLIEKELDGLMKRSLLVAGKGEKHEAGSEYYSIISQLEKEKIKLEYQLSYNDIKVQRSEEKIIALERDISSLK